MDKFEIYKNLQTEITSHLISLSINPEEIKLFNRLLKGNIYDLIEKEIFSSGYVLYTLKQVFFLLTTDNYKSAILKAVNLGEDTDTTGAVTGGLQDFYMDIKHFQKVGLSKLQDEKTLKI